METVVSDEDDEAVWILLTSSEVELMETFSSFPTTMAKDLELLTSSEVELMETLIKEVVSNRRGIFF